MEEAYNRDKLPIRLNSPDKQFLKTITINEIQEMYPALGNLELIRSQARGMDMKENPLIKFVEAFEDDTFTITDTGRIYFEEHKNRDSYIRSLTIILVYKLHSQSKLFII